MYRHLERKSVRGQAYQDQNTNTVKILDIGDGRGREIETIAGPVRRIGDFTLSRDQARDGEGLTRLERMASVGRPCNGGRKVR